MSSYKCIREKKRIISFTSAILTNKTKKEKDFKKCSYCVFSSTGRQTIEEAILQRLLIKLVVSQNELKSKPVYLKSWPLVGIASIKLFTIMLFNIRTQCHNESSFNVWATLDGGGVCHITFKLKKNNYRALQFRPASLHLWYIITDIPSTDGLTQAFH